MYIHRGIQVHGPRQEICLSDKLALCAFLRDNETYSRRMTQVKSILSSFSSTFVRNWDYDERKSFAKRGTQIENPNLICF